MERLKSPSDAFKAIASEFSTSSASLEEDIFRLKRGSSSKGERREMLNVSILKVEWNREEEVVWAAAALTLAVDFVVAVAVAVAVDVDVEVDFPNKPKIVDIVAGL